MPFGVLHSPSNYKERLELLNAQFRMKSRFKHRVWKQIVKAKILNQGAVLQQRYGYSGNPYESTAKLVEDGDKTGIEATVAHAYFGTLISKDFSRRSVTPINHLLNYGYAILRSLISQQIVLAGFELSFGIWHHGYKNPANFAYDLIEPFRPFVDQAVLRILDNGVLDASEARFELLSLLSQNVQIGNKTTTLFQAVEEMVKSMKTSILSESVVPIVLPEVIYVPINH
jgi:CRISPR-associated protein Cas1